MFELGLCIPIEFFIFVVLALGSRNLSISNSLMQSGNLAKKREQ